MKNAQPITSHYRGLGFPSCPDSLLFGKRTKCIYSIVGFVEARKDGADDLNWRQFLCSNARGEGRG